MRRLLLVLACSLPAAASRRDVDVAVPPGTPLEWTRELRTPTPSGWRGAIPTAAAPAEPGGTVAAERDVDFSCTSDVGISRITTRDLPYEFTWAVPTKSVSD